VRRPEGFEEGKREANVPLPRWGRTRVGVRPRLEWHEVKKVDHYYLSIDAVTQPMQVRDGEIPYGDQKK